VKALGGLAALAALGVGVWQLGCEPGQDSAGPAQAAPSLEAIHPQGMTVVPVYSPAIRSAGLIFLSGAVGNVPGQGLVEGGVEAETRQALANVATLLEAAGAGVSDLVQCNVYLADIADYQAMNAVYGAFVGDPPPARTTVGVADLPLGARVEIACTARDPGGA
jgi:2-iminobutanoate/2-iminopropanoate deaminase